MKVFHLVVSYEPCMVQNSSMQVQLIVTVEQSEHGYDDLTDVVIKYASGNFEGVGCWCNLWLQTGNTLIKLLLVLNTMIYKDKHFQLS